MITPTTTTLAPVPPLEAGGPGDPSTSRTDGFALLLAALAAAPSSGVFATAPVEPRADEGASTASPPLALRTSAEAAGLEALGQLDPGAHTSPPKRADASILQPTAFDGAATRAAGRNGPMASPQSSLGTSGGVAGIPSASEGSDPSAAAAQWPPVALAATVDAAPAGEEPEFVRPTLDPSLESATALEGLLAARTFAATGGRARTVAMAADAAASDTVGALKGRALQSLAQGAAARLAVPTPDRAATGGESSIERAPGSLSRFPGASAPAAPSVPRTSEAATTAATLKGDDAEPAPSLEPASLVMGSSEELAAAEPQGPAVMRPGPAGATSASPPPSVPPPSVQIAQAVFSADGAALERLRLRLHPVELGTVDVVVERERTGRARAILLAERPETLELLRRDLATLERLFAQAGLALEPGGLELGLQAESGGSQSGRSAPAQPPEIPAVTPPSPRAVTAVSVSLSFVDLMV